MRSTARRWKSRSRHGGSRRRTMSPPWWRSLPRRRPPTSPARCCRLNADSRRRSASPADPFRSFVASGVTMRALTLVADRKIELADLAPPPPPQAGEVQVRVKAVGLNHLDLWGFRGMAFAKRKLPLVIGAEAAGEIAAGGPDGPAFKPGAPVAVDGGRA